MTPEKILELLPKFKCGILWNKEKIDQCETCSGNRYKTCATYVNRKIANACANALAGKVEEVKQKCVWDYDSDNDFYYTVCGQDHVFTEGNILDNKHRYCPYCGGEIVEAQQRKANRG